MTRTYDIPECPLPGHRTLSADGAYDGYVIASGIYRDDTYSPGEGVALDGEDRVIYGLLILRSGPHPLTGWYVIMEFDALHRRYVTRSTHNNIVPAAAAFDETFGFWGG